MAIRITGDNHLWPHGVIPFEIDQTDFPPNSPGLATVLGAMDEWNNRTNITFVPRMAEKDYVHFRLGDSEKSSDSLIGRHGGKQEINGASLDVAQRSVVHEIGHAVGLFHEQCRQDRDRFVAIDLTGMAKESQRNFERRDAIGGDIGPYDYDSIMHYNRSAFAPVGRDSLIPVSWFGDRTGTAGIAIADISGNGKADDVVLFHIDKTTGSNAAYYRIIFGLQPDQTDSGMSELIHVPGWFGDDPQGGSIAIADIDGNGRPDLVVFFVDHAAGGNRGYYTVLWDLDTAGQWNRQSELIELNGMWFGASIACASVALAKVSNNDLWDLVVFFVDNPGGANSGYLHVGFDLGWNGRARAWLPADPAKPIPDWWGALTAGGGVTVGVVGGVLTIIAFHIDDPDGGNSGHVRIGQLQQNGAVLGWTKPSPTGGWYGAHTAAGDVAMIDFGGSPALVVFHIDNPDGENRGYLRIARNVTQSPASLQWGPKFPVHNFGPNAISRIGTNPGLSDLDIAAVNQMYPEKSVFAKVVRAGGWFGSETQAADAALFDIRGDGRIDLVMFFVDNPPDANHGYYRIGRNIGPSGVADGFSPRIEIGKWWGARTAAGGIAIADLTGSGRPSLVAMHIDDINGGNRGWYRVGWNLDPNGMTNAWTDPIPIAPPPSNNWFGERTPGAAIALGDISGSGQQDLLVFHIDDPAEGNRGYYRIGFDLDANGVAARWSPLLEVPGWFGKYTSGGGVALQDLNGSGQLDMIVFHIDNPPGENSGHYRIGWDLDTTGVPSGGWSPVIRIAGWFGDHSADGGIAVADINGDSIQDFVIFHIDNAPGENHGFYRTILSPRLH